MKGFITVFISVSLFGSTVSKRNGAGDGACVTMKPGHGTQQLGDSPFTLDVGSVMHYEPGGTVEVNVKSTDGSKFKGILLQARKRGTDTPQGTFSDLSDTMHTKACTAASDSVTHKDGYVEKEAIKVVWTAPDTDEGEIYFVATVAKGPSAWWMNVKTSYLSVKPDPTTTAKPVDPENPTDADKDATTKAGGPSDGESTDGAPALGACNMMIIFLTICVSFIFKIYL